MFAVPLDVFLALTFGTGFVTTVMMKVVDIVTSRARNKQTAAYLAMRLSNILETYWRDCSSYIGDNALFQEHDGHVGARRASMPKLPAFPEDPDGWRKLRIDLADRALAFPNAVASSEAFLQFYWDVVGDDATSACDSECALTGVLAIDLSDDLRSAFKLPDNRSKADRKRVADLRALANEERERRCL